MIDKDKEKQEPNEDYKDMEKNSEELNNFEVANNPAKDFMYFVFDLIKTGIIVFVIAFCLRYFAVQPFIVDGESMMPTYVNNEYILAEKISYMTGSPERGDVIVFRYPNNPNVSYIKRIIGLPGETIKIEDSTVTVYNDKNSEGTIIDEKYLAGDTLTLAEGTQSGAYSAKVPSNEYFVMGDNRQHSSDSREWGLLPKTNIIGRAWLTILPATKAGIQKRVNYNGLTSLIPTVSARN